MADGQLLGRSVLSFSQPLEKLITLSYPGETELQTKKETLGFSKLGWRELVGSRLGRSGIGRSRLRIMTPLQVVRCGFRIQRTDRSVSKG